jgi:hypothetical protein
VFEPNGPHYSHVLERLLRDRAHTLSVDEVAYMLRLSEALVAEGTGQSMRGAFSWTDVMALGMLHRWTIRMAARVAPPGVLPQGLATKRHVIALPAYQWALLAHNAELRRAGGMDAEYAVSDAVEEAIFQYLVSYVEDWGVIEQNCPTAERAAMWPGER